MIKKNIPINVETKKTITVFLVDDDALFLTALQHFLEDKNQDHIKIRTFHTGEECLKKIMEAPPDIVILDYYLNSKFPNVMNGIEVLKKIKSIQPATRVVMLSAQDENEIAINTIKCGAYDYINKSGSAFIKIKNAVLNISDHINNYDKLDRRIASYKYLHIFFILLVIVLFLLSRIL